MKKQLLSCLSAAMLALSLPAMAQNITSASGGVAATLNFDDGTSGPVFNTSTCNSLNVDAVEIDINAGAPSCLFGVGNGDVISVFGYTGITASLTPSTNFSGFTVLDYNNTRYPQPLPYWQSAQAGNTVNYVDVAIGVTEDYYYSSGSSEYFVLVTYESQGEIWLEYYQLDLSAGVVTHPPLNVGGGVTYVSNNPIQISNANGTAVRPHIELFHNKQVPATNKSHFAESFAVVWEQEDGSGNPEVWATDGYVSPSSHSTIPEQPASPFKVADGKVPDVVAVSATDPSDNSMAYVSYLNPDEDEVHLSEWALGSGSTTVTHLTQLGSSTTNPNEFHYPRISGPMYYDFSSGFNSNDPLAVVVVAENDGGGNAGINTYNYYSGGTVNTIVDASYDGGYGFDKSNNYSIMPMITGAGELATNLHGGSPYVEYPTTFYTDYTANGSGSYTAAGDYITMGTDKANGSTSPILDGGTDYWEVHNGNIMTTTAFSLSGTLPTFAIATANNSGESLFTAYFRGDDRILIDKTTTNYSFKPTSINSVANAELHVYPNPVTTELFLGDADGADYSITDITGKVMATGKVSGNKQAISTANYSAGTYILQVVKEGIPGSIKFTKQ